MRGGEITLEETTQTVSKKGGVNPVLIAVIVIVVLAGFGYMVMNSNKSATTEMTAEPTVAPKGGEAMTDEAMTGEAMGEVRTIEVEGGSFYYKPNEIRVKKGEKVKIVLNSVSMMHDFVIDELDVRTPIIKSGETATVEFTADQVGTFEYYCSVGQHRAQGMVGTLIVE